MKTCSLHNAVACALCTPDAQQVGRDWDENVAAEQLFLRLTTFGTTFQIPTLITFLQKYVDSRIERALKHFAETEPGVRWQDRIKK